MVVGHTKCGGVAAAYDAACSGGQTDEGEFWSICLSVLFLEAFRILFCAPHCSARDLPLPFNPHTLAKKHAGG